MGLAVAVLTSASALGYDGIDQLEPSAASGCGIPMASESHRNTPETSLGVVLEG